MTVKEFAQATGFSVISLPCPQKVVAGVYAGDLLSWVMGRANPSDAWVTIMSNNNIIAVATLADTSCIVLAEGVTIDADVLALANEKGVNVLKSDLPIYETAVRIHGALS